MTLDISDMVNAIYQTAHCTQSHLLQRVVLLHELIGAYNLTCTEIAGLTSEAASLFLLQQGAILEPLKQTQSYPLAGYIYACQQYGHIFIEKNDTLVRRRFSVAHEFGHYLLHFQPWIEQANQHHQQSLLEMSEAFAPFSADEETNQLPSGSLSFSMPISSNSTPSSLEAMEHEANQFAATLLMPAEIVRGLLANYAPVCVGDDLLWRLSTEMLVSREALYWRLCELHLSSFLTAPLN